MMQIGSLVETVADFEEERRIYGLPYPNKGDILIVSLITEHPNAKNREKGMVLLYFEELPDLIGVCDKQKDGTPNFVELLPPIQAAISETYPYAADSLKFQMI